MTDPWHISKRDTWFVRSASEPVALVYGNATHAEANLRLIAAAPDLLAAVQALVEQRLIREPYGAPYLSALEAIAKATGDAVIPCGICTLPGLTSRAQQYKRKWIGACCWGEHVRTTT
jgi:hypothetical protein